MVGPITESRDAHLKRHQGGMKACPRCRWYASGHTWMATYGGLATQGLRAGPLQRFCWIAERPAAWGGHWGLGCTLCADALGKRACAASAPSRGERVRQPGGKWGGPQWRLSGHWARFDVRSMTLQAEQIRQHACSDMHKLAVQAFLCPGEPAVLGLQADAADDDLLRGAVPQPADWVRCWRAVREGESWNAAEKHCKTEHWISQMRDRWVLRRAVQNMALVMREVIRSRKRQWIKDCTTISISFDDRKAHKLVVFNCDMPLRHRGAGERPIRHGIVGCLDLVHGESLESMDGDAAERTADRVVRIIETFATPLGENTPDEQVVAKFRQATQSITVDGALQKTGQLLAARFCTRTVLVCRDPAHMIRIACSQPLERTGRFEEQFNRLFDGRYAFFKSVQHSEIWQSRLQAAQEYIIGDQGAQGAGIKKILRHFSFAQHRWETFAAPRRHYACLLNAIFVCLAGIYNDTRKEKPQRELAKKCLDAMNARDILECGLAGDYSEFCMRWEGVSGPNPWAASALLLSFIVSGIPEEVGG